MKRNQPITKVVQVTPSVRRHRSDADELTPGVVKTSSTIPEICARAQLPTSAVTNLISAGLTPQIFLPEYLTNSLVEQIARTFAKSKSFPGDADGAAKTPISNPQGRSPNLLTLSEVCTRVHLSRSQIYRMIQRGQFPPPLKLSVRAARWLSSNVDNWISEKSVASTGRF